MLNQLAVFHVLIAYMSVYRTGFALKIAGFKTWPPPPRF